MIWLQITNLIYIFIFIITYFSKKRIKSDETKIFKYIIISNCIGLIIDLCCYLTVSYMEIIPIINSIVTKLLLVYYLIYILLFTYYLLLICKNHHTEKYKSNCRIGCYLYFIFNVCAVIFLPMYYNNDVNGLYSYGPAVDYLYVAYGALITIWCILIFRNYKYLKNNKKMIPIIILIILGTIVGILQKKFPQLLIMTAADTLVTVIMYFTIENPDMKLINELNIAKDQADKANQAKSEFLSSMSHEIRTPLNAIVGFSQALMEEEIPKEAKEEVEDIMMASNSLLELVNGILDISKIESGKIEIVNTEYQFKKVFDELVILTKARLGDKPLDFRYQYDDSIPKVFYGDYTRIKQVILNILTNSVKYTKEGYIDFKISSIKKDDICRIIVSVEDSGIGIKEENIPKLFSKFERFDLEKNITIEGTGLGLAITKKLIELMNGTIVVQSVYGKGSKFTIAIDQRIIEKEIKEEKEETRKEVKVKDVSGGKVLIVDDNKVNLKVASRLLEPYQLEITTVESGTDSIDLVEKNNYDLILMDDMMPKMSGVETLKKLKEKEEFHTPVVALTANAISGMREKYIEEGFDDYLAKPINKEELKEIVMKFLGKEKR